MCRFPALATLHRTLEEAVDLMAGGGVPNPHLDAFLKPVRLTAAERATLLVFLRELTVELDGPRPALPPP